MFYQQNLFQLYYIQNDTTNDMLHTVIEGEPGLGKTELAKILGEIYCSFTNFNRFNSIKRCDLIGEYLGQTVAGQKRQYGDVFLEGFAELMPGAAETAIGITLQKRKANKIKQIGLPSQVIVGKKPFA